MEVHRIKKLGRGLKKFLHKFSDCSARNGPRKHLRTYVQGQLSGLPRKLEGGNLEGPLAGPDEDVRLTTAASGSQTIRFDRFTFQVFISTGCINLPKDDAPVSSSWRRGLTVP